jgi:putative DNA primase/helicase
MSGCLRDGSSNDGLIQRLQLLVWPDIRQEWRYVDRGPNLAAIDGAAEIFRRIAAVDPATPLRLRFANDAQDLFESWLTNLELRIRANDLPPSFQSHLAKYRSLMPSLALLFALADGHVDEVPLYLARLACDSSDT